MAVGGVTAYPGLASTHCGQGSDSKGRCKCVLVHGQVWVRGAVELGGRKNRDSGTAQSGWQG